MAVSQYQTGGAILWALDNSTFYGTSNQAAPTLYAYDATNIASAPIFSATAGTTSTGGYAIEFAVPTVANGHVYVGNANQLVVFH